MKTAAVAAPAKPPVVPAPRGAPKVTQSSDERFTAVVEFNTCRLRHRRAKHGTKEARKMGRTAKDMKHSPEAEFYFTGKTPLKEFTRLHKLDQHDFG